MSETLSPSTEDLVRAPSSADDYFSVRELTSSTATNEFADLLNRELPDHYDEVDSSFADNLFKVGGLDSDPDGYFTLRKRVYVGFLGDSPFGFTVATFKRGGSVKIGPTAVFAGHRRRGLASQLRDNVEDHLFDLGVRKLYMTIATSNVPALMFNLGRGFCIEGVLRSQYGRGRDELVLGRFASVSDEKLHVIARTADRLEPAAQSQAIPSVAPKREEQSELIAAVWESPAVDDVRRFLHDQLIKYISDLDSSFYSHMVEACAPERQFYHRKGKSIIAVRDASSEIVAMAVFVPKRGGAAKLSPLVTTSETALRILIDKCAEHARAVTRHKLYAHVPLHMGTTAQVLQDLNFRVEAQLREPYKSGADILVLGAEVA